MKWIFCLLVVALSAECIKAMTESECKETLKGLAGSCDDAADDQDYTDLMRNERNPRKSTKCLRQCFMERMDLMTNDCKMDAEKISDVVSMAMEGKEDEVTEVVNDCNKKITCVDKCDAAHEYSMCVLDELESRGWEVPTIDKD